MRVSCVVNIVALIALAAMVNLPRESAASSRELEAFVQAPMPPGFEVVVSELEGPVFADSRGMTLYKWPHRNLRNGYVGDEKQKSACTGTVTRVSAGLMSPYPPGLMLPDLDKRLSCAEAWPPVIATRDSKPVGQWSLIDRADGSRQWAYAGQALYTSMLDTAPGDVRGGTGRRGLAETAPRVPVGPPANVPPGLAVVTTARGRLVVNDRGFSVYASERDGADQSSCDAECALTWEPVPAPALAESQGEWTIVERAPGVRQWAFRGRPLYTYLRDINLYSQQGSDVPGWSNVYTQRAPSAPAQFTLEDTPSGVVLADARGHTVYVYSCSDDSLDQLACDYPGAPPVYKIAICGGGNASRCLATWPYVLATAEAKSESRSWSVLEINPETGDEAKSGSTDVLRVWAYRGRPVHTYAGDQGPGDINGSNVGEFAGARNGFRAFWVRDDFFRNDT